MPTYKAKPQKLTSYNSKPTSPPQTVYKAAGKHVGPTSYSSNSRPQNTNPVRRPTSVRVLPDPVPYAPSPTLRPHSYKAPPPTNYKTPVKAPTNYKQVLQGH